MLPISLLSEREARRVEGLLFDLDDTLLSEGRLSERAYSALFRLRESGLQLLAVTGRPAGWGEVIARMWPIEGVVSENGAAFSERSGASVVTRVRDPDALPQRRARVQSVAARLEREYSLVRADDVPARVTDITFDIGETREVPDDIVAAAMRLAGRLGARTTRSSVHLHVTLERDDKASGAVRVLRERFGVDVTRALATRAFVGDSENDAACFAAFHTTVAVSNLRGRPSVAPRFVTRGARGEGFAELAEVLTSRRGS